MSKNKNQLELTKLEQKVDKIIVRSFLNRPFEPGEPPTGPSQTVPDQTMSVREIMDRYAKGLPLDGQKVAMYEDEVDDMDEYLPDPKRLDLAEREAIKDMVKDQLKQMEERRQAKINEDKQKAKEKKIQEAEEIEVISEEKKQNNSFGDQGNKVKKAP